MKVQVKQIRCERVTLFHSYSRVYPNINTSSIDDNDDIGVQHSNEATEESQAVGV